MCAAASAGAGSKTARKTAPAPARRTQAQRREEMRVRLLDAAVDVLRVRGYAGLRTAEVAAKAGVSPGALTHHFASKDELILAALEHVFRQAAERGTRRAHRVKTADAVLRLLIEDSQEFFFSDLFLIAMELAIFARTDTPNGAQIRSISRTNRVAVEAAWIAALIEAGVPEDLAEDLLWLTNSIVRGLAVRRLWQDEPARFKRLVLMWRRMVADYLRVDGARRG